MIIYRLFYAKPIKKDFKHLPRSVLKKLKEKHFPKLSQNPYIGELLMGSLRDIWKYKFSFKGTSYRIAYQIIEKNIIILIVGKRGDFYKLLRRRVK